jgi:hypothetical protein
MVSFFDRIKSKKNPILLNMNLILYNRFVLYFIFGISIYQLFILSAKEDYYPVIIFILISFVTSFFSRNMLVILTIALAIMNILKYGTHATMEGYGNSDDSDDSDDVDDNPPPPKSSPTTKAAAMNEYTKSYNELIKIKDQITEGLLLVTDGLLEAETKVTQIKESLKQAQ